MGGKTLDPVFNMWSFRYPWFSTESEVPTPQCECHLVTKILSLTKVYSVSPNSFSARPSVLDFHARFDTVQF